MEEKTLKELQADLIEAGMSEEDAGAFRSKAAAQATLTALTSTKITEAPEVAEEDKVQDIEERPNPSEDREVNKAWKSKAERMKVKLLSQESVSILVPLDPEEQIGEVEWVNADTNDTVPLGEWLKLPLNVKMRTYQKHISGAIKGVQLNGYKFFIPKGVYYQVPLQIFEVVNEANMEQLKATQYKNLDRVDPSTGRPFKDSF